MNKNIWQIIFVILALLLIVFKDTIFYTLSKITIKPYFIVDNIYESNIKKDYTDLLSINNIDYINSYKYKYSKILFNDIYDYIDEITIYYGNNDGLDTKMAVLNEYGLIGYINNVDKHTSKVKLLKSKDINISVRINNSYGILNYSNNRFIVNGISISDEIKENDIVYTSGLGFIPEFIPVGVVQSIETNGIEFKIYIKPYVNFNNINFVVILGDIK